MNKAILFSFSILMMTGSLIAQSNKDISRTNRSDSCSMSSPKSVLCMKSCVRKSDTLKNYLSMPKPLILRGTENGLPPLYIIDGVISNHGTLGLDVNNIESISVSKNSRAINLYGEKARGGVILITTKKKTI